MRFCIFDLDHTLLKTNISFRYFFYLVSLRIFPFHFIFFSIYYFLLYRTRIVTLKGLHEKVFKKFMENRPLDMFEKHVERFLEKHLDQMINQELLDRLKSYQREGDFVAVFSSTPLFLLSSISKKLNIHKAKGTEYQVDKRGILCKISSLVDGNKKAELAVQIASEMNIPKQKMIVFTDSIEDFPLIEVAGRAVLVNPDRKLRMRMGFK